MAQLLGKNSKKVISSLLIFAMFVYISVFICLLPGSYTIKKVDGQWTSTHTLAQLVDSSNEKFISLLKLDLGKNKDGNSLTYLATNTSKYSLVLLFCGLALGIVLGIFKGILDSRREKGSDSSLKVLGTIIPISLPDVLIIALLQKLAILLQSKGIEVLKVAGSGSANHLILPVVALAILPSCYIARLTAMAIEDCYRKDYIKAAIGKGCSKRRILWNHVMRNAIPSVIDSLPTITAMLIGNLMMVEYLFSYPGLTKSLMVFYMNGDRNGIIANVILIGIIYFILEIVFRLLKMAASKPLKEEGI